jgi:hypothetical protein
MTIEKEILVSGGLVRIAKLRHECFDFLQDPVTAIGALQRAKTADLFTFLQDFNDGGTVYPFYKEAFGAAVLPVTNYELWWNNLASSVRNKIRKAYKSGVEVRLAELNEDFARGVEGIYNEAPTRQGRRFWYYGKKADFIKQDLTSLFDRCYFVGAYLGGEMIGFMKLFHGNNILRTVHIIAKLSQRDKAVQDALIARAVQICEQKGIRYLQYGSWSQGGLGSFKVKRGFVKLDYPRYYVPLTWRGKLILRLHLHHGWKGRLSPKWLESLIVLRTSWNNFRYGVRSQHSTLSKSNIKRDKSKEGQTGEVAERSKAASPKGCYATNRIGGSNPSPLRQRKTL